MMMFARLQRHALGTGGLRVRLGSATATVFASNAVGATLPGGSLLSLTYRTRRMRSWGASASQIGFAHAVTGVLSTIAFALLAGAGRVLAGDSSQLLWVAVQIGAICALTSAVLALLHHPAVLRRPVRAFFTCCAGCAAVSWSRRRPTGSSTNWLPCTPGPILGMGARSGPVQLGRRFRVSARRVPCGRSITPLSTALFAYIAGMTAASALPLLPAGIGVLDAALIFTLHHGGVPVSAATAADLLFRTISPGLVSIAGWVLLVQQRRRPARPQRVRDSDDHARTVSATPDAAAEQAQ
ncbi:YbhN family protein [Streptomyces kaempferi]